MRTHRHFLLAALSLLLCCPLVACKSETVENQGAPAIPEGCPVRGQTLELNSPPGSLYLRDLRFFQSIGDNPVVHAPDGKVFAIARYVWTPTVPVAPVPTLPPLPAKDGTAPQTGKPSQATAAEPTSPKTPAQPPTNAPDGAKPTAATAAPDAAKPATTTKAPDTAKPTTATAAPDAAKPTTTTKAPDGAKPTTATKPTQVTPNTDAAAKALPIVPPGLQLVDRSGTPFPPSQEAVDAYNDMVEADPMATPLPTEFTAVWILDPATAQEGIFLITPEMGADGTPLRFCLGRHKIELQ